MTRLIYHMCRADEWQVALATGLYHGSSQDLADGFIHFSTADQVQDSAARHRAGQDGLVLLAVDCRQIETMLKWEMSRRGMMFPHVYGALPVGAVLWARDLPLDRVTQRHVFPDLGD